MLAAPTRDRPTAAIAPIDPSHRKLALHTLTLAFADDPPCRWLYPQDADYRQYFPLFATAFGGAAIDRGTAIATSDLAGVALWMEPGLGPDDAALEALIEQSAPAERKGAVFDLVGEMGRVHPSEPHWYLPLIGVAPASQGRGLGSALLETVLAECDAAVLPAYLEATSPRSIPLYRSHGFVPLREIRVGDCPPIMPMLRQPQSS